MKNQFSFGRYIILCGVPMFLGALFTVFGFEAMARQVGVILPISLVLVFAGLMVLICADLSQKLNVWLITVMGIAGWLLTYGLGIWYLYWSKGD